MRGVKRKVIKRAGMGGGDHAELQRGGEGGGASDMARVKGDHVTMKP